VTGAVTELTGTATAAASGVLGEVAASDAVAPLTDLAASADPTDLGTVLDPLKDRLAP